MGQKKVSVLVKSGVKLHARTVLGGKREGDGGGRKT